MSYLLCFPSPCKSRRMFGNKNSFSCHVDFIVNQICRFPRTMKKEPRANLTVACHRNPKEYRRQVNGDNQSQPYFEEMVLLLNDNSAKCCQRFLKTEPLKSIRASKIVKSRQSYSNDHLVYHLRNRKHVPCFYRVIQTRVEVWENEKCCGKTSRRRVFPQLFRVLPNFHERLYNSIETRSTCFLFLLENNATRKRKTTC